MWSLVLSALLVGLNNAETIKCYAKEGIEYNEDVGVTFKMPDETECAAGQCYINEYKYVKFINNI